MRNNKRGKASRTADSTAGGRAFESMRSEDERLFYDPYAIDFLEGIYRIIFKLFFKIIPVKLLIRLLELYGERLNPGGISNVALRTKYIDDYLNECIDRGIKQLVILGAGHDSRAYRFDSLIGRVKVYELDHPSTQKRKIEKIRKIFGALPDYVTYVSIDFNKQTLDERLLNSGYDKNLETLFIWEGVTSYLTAESVDKTLAFVVNNSGKGSSIIFDYLLKSVIEGTFEGAEKFRRWAEKCGEPLTFGIEEGTIEEFLKTKGFSQVINMPNESMRAKYYRGTNQQRKIIPFLPVVHATVKPR